MYIHVPIYAPTCIYEYLYIYTYMHIPIQMFNGNTYVYLFAYICIYMYLHRHQYVYIWNMDLFIYLLFSDTPVYLSRHHDVSPSHSPCRFQATAGRRSWPLRATTSSSSTSTTALQARARQDVGVRFALSMDNLWIIYG